MLKSRKHNCPPRSRFLADKSKSKGSVMLVAAITSAVILGFIGLSVTKLNSFMFRSLDTSGISRQAQEYASARADMVKGIKYSELQGMTKKFIDGSKGYYEEVLLGGEVVVPEDSSMMKRNLTINVYKDSETIPRASLVVPRYSSGDSTGQYVVNNAFTAEKSKKLSLDVDKNNRFVAADDKGNSQKLLSSIAETYKGDLNNLKETGIFTGSNLGNAPDTGAYSIENIRQSDVSGVYVNQRITNFNEDKTYTRQCRNGSWSPWAEFGGGGGGLKIFTGELGFEFFKPRYIPLPEGYTREQCKYAAWIKSAKDTSISGFSLTINQGNGLVEAKVYRDASGSHSGNSFSPSNAVIEYLVFAQK